MATVPWLPDFAHKALGEPVWAVQPLLTPERENMPMLSPTSFSAFSPTVTQPGPGTASPVQRIRAVSTPPARPASPTEEVLALPGRDGGISSGRPLPRGSLLDVSV
jgi:hypothetical protein